MKIFTKYSIRQFIVYTFAGLVLFSFLLLMDEIFHIAEIVILKGVGFSEVFMLIIYAIPSIIVLSMPMAFAAGTILFFGRMASDGEITAVRTSGNTLRPVFMPVFFISLITCFVMLPFNYYLAPVSQNAFRNHFIGIAARHPALQLEENVLIDAPPYTLVCLEVDRDRNLLKELIMFKEAEDSEPAVSITARKGRWIVESDDSVTLVLYDGEIRHQDRTDPRKFSSARFEEHTFDILSSEDLQRDSKRIDTMTGAEMRKEITRLKKRALSARQIQVHYHLRSALAGAIPILLITGMPFGIRAEKKGKTIGIGISIFVIAVYYFLMVAGLKTALDGRIPPFLGAWLANIVTGSFGTVMFVKGYFK